MRNKKQLLARTLATVMTCVMPFTTCPVTTFAATGSEGTDVQAGNNYVYGLVNLSYADYYYGELNQVAESPEPDFDAQDKAAALRDSGMYDAVTSATASKYKSFATTYYAENEGAGGTIYGIKDVAVAVPESLYNAAQDAVKNGTSCSNKLLEIVSSMSITDTVPNEYKVLNGDGTLTEMRDSNDAVEVNDAQISLANNTTWGQYQISIVSDKLPEKEDMEGVIIETSDGAKYGMKHLENLWFKTGEMAFAVTEGFKVPQGNTLTSARYADIPGKTITKITYIVRGGADVTFTTDLFCKTLLDKEGGYKYSGENAVYQDGAQIKMTGVTPADSNYSLEGVSFNNNTLVKGTDYTYENDVLTVKKTDNTGIGKYTLTYSDSKYENITSTVQFTSSMTSDEINISENSLKISNETVTISEYLNAIDSIKVNGAALRGSKLGTAVFNEDGTVNFDASISFHGSKTQVFPDADTEYTIEVTSAGYPSVSGTVKSPVAEYQYVYAGLSWAEFWSGEDVYMEGAVDASSNEADSKGEYDKGAFDVVSRATTNHGLHRGSYQSSAVIYDTDGKTYEVSYWTDATAAVLTDGSTIKFEKGAITYTDAQGTEHSAVMDHYEVKGIKYVPVAVKTEDFEEFVSKYPVTKKGEAIAGGYSENNLEAYSKTAEVTADTNGLKTAVKNADGTFSFSRRVSGSGSGIMNETQKKAENIVVTVKEASGSYGEFLRVDLTGDGYGALGANMYAVRWTYYGSDSEYKTPLASYGTKFAADNWMHKSNGIQLGLTDSLRCSLPNGTDGTGCWELTVYAMGYEDYTVRFNASDENIVKNTDTNIDTAALQEAVNKAKELNKEDYTAQSWEAMQTELAEAEAELAAPHSQAAVDEALSHLNSAVQALEKETKPVSIEGMKVSLKSSKYYYDGKQKKPAVTVENLKVGLDYTVAYKNNKNIGKATVTITGTGNYTGTVTKTFTITVKKGASYKVGNLKYKITKASETGKGTVEVISPASSNIKSAVIPASVKVGGVAFKVTSVGKNAFKGLKNLKSVTIGSNVKSIGAAAFSGDKSLKAITVKSKVLSKVGSKALSGINKKAKIKVPSSKVKAYTKLFKGKGQAGTVKVTK